MKKWKLVGYDTFSNEDYSISEHKTQEAAEQAACERIISLEKSQPSQSSGGQAFMGIQDRVYIERPDGTTYRWVAPSRVLDALAAGQDGMKAQFESAKKDLNKIANVANKLRHRIERQLKTKKKKK